MKCDKCGQEAEIQKFHQSYVDYLKLNQINGFCHSCWDKIVEENGTWLDICVKEAICPHIIKSMSKEDFEKEYKSIFVDGIM